MYDPYIDIRNSCLGIVKGYILTLFHTVLCPWNIKKVFELYLALLEIAKACKFDKENKSWKELKYVNA